MTGLVKEELLTRQLEVGIRIESGQIVFDPILLRRQELLTQPESWIVHGVDGRHPAIRIPAGTLGATVCQVPVLVSASERPEIVIRRSDGSDHTTSGTRLDRRTSALVFGRTGVIDHILVRLPLSDPPVEQEVATDG
jgi:hypothetical protein